jgi:hypothetical protein
MRTVRIGLPATHWYYAGVETRRGGIGIKGESMKTLFDENRLGKMTLKNRFIRAAVGETTLDGRE